MKNRIIATSMLLSLLGGVQVQCAIRKAVNPITSFARTFVNVTPPEGSNMFTYFQPMNGRILQYNSSPTNQNPLESALLNDENSLAQIYVKRNEVIELLNILKLAPEKFSEDRLASSNQIPIKLRELQLPAYLEKDPNLQNFMKIRQALAQIQAIYPGAAFDEPSTKMIIADAYNVLIRDLMTVRGDLERRANELLREQQNNPIENQ